MKIGYFYSLNLIMVIRLLFIFREKAQSLKIFCILSILQILGFVAFNFNWVLFYLLSGIMLINIIFYILDKKYKNTNLLRLLSLLIIMIFLSVFFSSAISMKFNPILLQLFLSLKKYSFIFVLLGKVNWQKSCILLMGILLLINEINILIRLFFQFFDLVPLKKITKDDSII